jgi:acetyltransferase-like isoleucine patch superfamily enzyme
VAGRPIRIGRNVWIGFDACVLPGVTIGEGSIVGARSVVFADVAPWTLVAGNPARVIRALDEEG